MRKVELLKTIKGSRVWGKGEKISEPFPPDLQQEVSLIGTIQDRGTVRVIEEPDPISELSLPSEPSTRQQNETLISTNVVSIKEEESETVVDSIPKVKLKRFDRKVKK